MNKNELFESLVDNALDFLYKAIEEIDQHPKYSVIHFYTAVELIIKARLMHEHWSLIIAKNNEPDWEKFVAGDFQSINLDEAANKLQKIAQSGLSKAEVESFKTIAKHRNKMVHFFHGTDKNTNDLKQEIVKQQLKAWYYLHHLIGERWKDVFAKHTSQIALIDTQLRKLHDFLQIVFENLNSKIAEAEGKGYVFAKCPSCNFKAEEHESEFELIYIAECYVCRFVETCVKIECKYCDDGVITYAGEGDAKCPICGAYHKSGDLADALIDQAAAHIAAKEGDFDAYIGNCAICDGYKTVVQVKNTDIWFCSQCFDEPSQMSTCNWCNGLSSGDMEFSYVQGCSQCDGMAGWHKDD